MTRVLRAKSVGRQPRQVAGLTSWQVKNGSFHSAAQLRVMANARDKAAREVASASMSKGIPT